MPTDTTYHRLFSTLHSQLSQHYTNDQSPGYATFRMACENATKYPYYAYNKLVRCYGLLKWGDLSYADNVSAYYTLVKDTEKKLARITQNMKNSSPNLPSLEWISIVRHYLHTINITLLPQSYHLAEQHKFDRAIQQVHLADTLLENAEQMLEASHPSNSTFLVPVSSLSLKQAAGIWLQHTQHFLNYVRNVSNTSTQSIEEKLMQSQYFFENTSYYLSLMKAAEAYGLLHYIYQSPTLTNRTVALESCETVIEFVDQTMTRIYENPFIDAPFAQENIELAKLHLKDAQQCVRNSTAISVASLCLQEAFMAQQQGQCMLDVLNLHKTGIIPEEDDDVHLQNVGSSHIVSLSYSVMIFVILVGFVLLIIFVLKKR